MPAITSDSRPAVAEDVRRGPYPRLTSAAVERAKTRLGLDRIDDIYKALGFSEMTFWRLRRGQHDIRYSHALRVANSLRWPLDRVFDLPQGGRRG